MVCFDEIKINTLIRYWSTRINFHNFIFFFQARTLQTSSYNNRVKCLGFCMEKIISGHGSEDSTPI